VLAFQHQPRESLKKLNELYAFLRDKCNAVQRQSFYATLMGRKVQSIAGKDREDIDKKDLEQFNEVLENLSTGEAASSPAEGTEGKK
jgi:hypothetical protein